MSCVGEEPFWGCLCAPVIHTLGELKRTRSHSRDLFALTNEAELPAEAAGEGAPRARSRVPTPPIDAPASNAEVAGSTS